MLFGELLPQNLGISAPLGTAKVVAGPLRAFSRAVGPLITLLNGSANRVLRAVGVEPQEELSSARTPEELAALVRRSAEVGTLDETTAEIITRSLDFGERTAADVMTPRVRTQVVRRGERAPARLPPPTVPTRGGRLWGGPRGGGVRRPPHRLQPVPGRRGGRRRRG